MSDIHIYSSLASDQSYQTEAGDIFIAGKANVANRHFLTPKGVVTRITEDQYEALKKNPIFQAHAKNEFVLASLRKEDAETVGEHLNDDDKSQQDTPTRVRKRGRKQAANLKED